MSSSAFFVECESYLAVSSTNHEVFNSGVPFLFALLEKLQVDCQLMLALHFTMQPDEVYRRHFSTTPNTPIFNFDNIIYKKQAFADVSEWTSCVGDITIPPADVRYVLFGI